MSGQRVSIIDEPWPNDLLIEPEIPDDDTEVLEPVVDDTDFEPEPEPERRRPLWRRILSWMITTLACLLVLYGLVGPVDINKFTIGAFARIPVEALVFVGLVLILPLWARRTVAILAGVVLGLLIILKLFDMGFIAVLYRGFDPVIDWAFLQAGVDYVRATSGGFAATAAVVGAVVLGLAVVVFTTLAALRLTRVVRRHRKISFGVTQAFVVLWLVCAVLGVQFIQDTPVASKTAAQYTYDHLRQLPADLQDAKNFAAEANVDAFRNTPASQLLTGLRGKDVILTFVESYGRTAVENPDLAPDIDALLDSGTAKLRAAGFDSRSAFVTSSTFGGGSWLAHATLDSGLWVNNQQRYRNLVATDRLTLTSAFRKAGWRTVGVEPAVIHSYPEGAFFGYNKVYGASDVGYRGTRFSYATMPDQYILSAFQRNERAKPDHTPVMAQIVTLTSHAPWSPVPQLIDWNKVGDGTIFDSMAGTNNAPESIFNSNPTEVRANYKKSIEYALNNLISYVQNYGDPNLVLVFLGDHQPASVVTGQNAPHDVPITIVAHDPAVLNRIAPWNWTPGLKPAANAPVWRMDAFRDKFLSAFGSAG
jgi:hypothetical protein